MYVLWKMHLPASLESVSAAAFPKFLEAIEVDAGNAQYASVDGVLFSKDLKKINSISGIYRRSVQYSGGN